MNNGLAWILLLGGVAVVIIGVRGSQHALFPWLPNLGSGTSPVPTGQLGTTGTKVPPGQSCSCPTGYVLVTHWDGTVDCTDPLRGHGTVAPICK